MVDAYRDISIPFQMSTIEFFKSVKEHLNEGGNMVVNMNMYDESENSITHYLQSTIANVFNYTYSVITDGTNREVIASDIDVKEKLDNNISKIPQYEIRNLMSYVSYNLERYEDTSKKLTDDKAPVEMLGMRALDKMIEAEIKSIRDSIKGKIIGDIIKELT